MRSLLALTFLTLLCLLPFQLASVHADDGIPDNCEYAQSAEQKAIIPRYSASTQQLVLVSWTTGQQVRTLDNNVQVVSILGWSADCRYLAVAEGTIDVMNTVVYDTTNSQRMGSVDDAHHQPHHITWGINDNLVVETRNGAILWNVPSGQRFALTQSYNTTTARNFSRLRWDSTHNQLITDLAVGGRVVYDLTTGTVVPVAAEQDGPQDADAGDPHVVIAGRSYDCPPSSRYTYSSDPNWYGSSGVANVGLDYDDQNHLISLKLFDTGSPDATIETLENNIQASHLDEESWSPTCRYAAAALWLPGQNVSDTIVYDVVLGKRVGIVPGARQIPHPLLWGSDGHTLLVQTRSGAILWNLATNTQTTISVASQVAVTGHPDVRNFNAVTWTNDQLLAVPVDQPNTVMAYDLASGASHALITFDHPVKELQSKPAGWIAVGLDQPSHYEDEDLIVFQGDGSPRIDLGAIFSISDANLSFSPNGHYFVYGGGFDGTNVWNTASGQQTTISKPDDFYDYQFVDNVTLRSFSGILINVETGAVSSTVSTAQPTVRPALAGQDGWSRWQDSWFDGSYHDNFNPTTCGSQTAHFDPAQGAIIVSQNHANRTLVANLNDTYELAWSPDCQIIFGSVTPISSVNRPYDTAPLDDTALSYDITFWNATTGAKLGAIPHPYRAESFGRVDWSPDSHRAFVRTTAGYFIFVPATREQIPLNYAGPVGESGEIDTDYSVYWDFTHGRLFVTTWGGVVAFDLRTGTRIALLTPDQSASDCGYYWGCSFKLSPDGRDLYVYGETSLGQYDFLTLQGVQVDVDNLDSVGSWYATATSPDGRYLVVGNYDFRVWDVAHLSQTFNARDPVITFSGPDGRAAQIVFTDNTTLKVTTGYGEISYWNVETGKQIVQKAE